MKQTAVEWYNLKVIELMTQREQENIDVLEFRNQLDLLLTQAKEMEKEQIIKAYWAAYKEALHIGDKTADEYYNETFKKTEQ